MHAKTDLKVRAWPLVIARLFRSFLSSPITLAYFRSGDPLAALMVNNWLRALT